MTNAEPFTNLTVYLRVTILVVRLLRENKDALKAITQQVPTFLRETRNMFRWFWSKRPWQQTDLMTVEEAATYAGVSSSTVRRVAKLHPEMVMKDGNGRNPRYIRREVHRFLKMAPKRATPNR